MKLSDIFPGLLVKAKRRAHSSGRNLHQTKKGPGRFAERAQSPVFVNDPKLGWLIAGFPGAKLRRKMRDNQLAKGTPR